MRELASLAAGTVLCGALACATAGTPMPMSVPPLGATAADEFKATGEVYYLTVGGVGMNAGYDWRRVVGPTVNMTRNDDGTWAGSLNGRNLLLRVQPGQVMGADMALTIEREGEDIRIGGLWFQRRIEIWVSPKRVHGTIDSDRCYFDLPAATPGRFEGKVGCTRQRPDALPAVGPPPSGLPDITISSLRLDGQAGNLAEPEMPQLALALLAVFMPPQ